MNTTFLHRQSQQDWPRVLFSPLTCKGARYCQLSFLRVKTGILPVMEDSASRLSLRMKRQAGSQSSMTGRMPIFLLN